MRCLHLCVCVHVDNCACMYVTVISVCLSMFVCRCIGTHVYDGVQVHGDLLVCLHACRLCMLLRVQCMSVCFCVCLYAIRVRVHACVCVCVCVHVHVLFCLPSGLGVWTLIDSEWTGMV